MESVLLGLVVTVCIYILYCIFTPAKEGFTSLSQSEENRLGAVASTINSPTNWDTAGNNPTNLIATAANPESYGTNQNTYNTALGNPNTGPRIDDTTSLLYMIDFCHNGAKIANPFSDSKFATSCGVCMTQGTLINGTAGSNLGVVVFPEDKAYSIAQGIDAVPSARSATCAPIVKMATSSSNVRSVVINSDQYTTTKAYMQSNSYTIISGTGAGTKTFACSGSSNGHNYVIKKGAYRDGLWDTHIAGAPVDYSRKNLLTTTPFDDSCTEKNSCRLTTSSVQWDASSLCGYPKPTPITTLGLDGTKTTPTSLTFIWTGGEYAESVTYSLVKDSDNSTIPGNKATLNLPGKFVTYTGLRPNTVYTFTLVVSNPAGSADGSYTASVSGFTNFVEDFTGVTGRIKGETGDDRDKVAGLAISNIGQTNFTATWTGGQNALTITLTLSDNTNTVIQSIDKAPGATVCQFTNLVASTTYRVMLLATYADGPSISITATSETAPVPRVPMSGVSFSGVTPRGFTVSWSGCDNASGITLMLSGPGSPANQMLSGTTKSYTYNGLNSGSMYSLSSRVTYPSGAPLTFGPFTQKTSEPPPPPPAVSGVPSVSYIKQYATLLGTFMTSGINCRGAIDGTRGGAGGGAICSSGFWNDVGISFNADYNGNPVNWSPLENIAGNTPVLYFIQTDSDALASVSPITGVYRDFGNNAVRFNYKDIREILPFLASYAKYTVYYLLQSPPVAAAPPVAPPIVAPPIVAPPIVAPPVVAPPAATPPPVAPPAAPALPITGRQPTNARAEGRFDRQGIVTDLYVSFDPLPLLPGVIGEQSQPTVVIFVYSNTIEPTIPVLDKNFFIKDTLTRFLVTHTSVRIFPNQTTYVSGHPLYNHHNFSYVAPFALYNLQNEIPTYESLSKLSSIVSNIIIPASAFVKLYNKA